jgi:methoxymalonate biosynthesis acyl carrier protein
MSTMTLPSGGTSVHSASTDIDANVVAELRAFLLGRLGLTDLDVDTDLFQAGLVTSLFAVELVAHVETTYGFEIKPCDLTPERFRSIAAMARLVTENQWRDATR